MLKPDSVFNSWILDNFLIHLNIIFPLRTVQINVLKCSFSNQTLIFLQLENYFSSLKNPKLRVSLMLVECLVYGFLNEIFPIPSERFVVCPGGAGDRQEAPSEGQ